MTLTKPDNKEITPKQIFKKDINYVLFAIIFNLLFQLIGVSIASFIISDQVLSTAVGMYAGDAVSFLLLMLYFKGRLSLGDIFSGRSRMTPRMLAVAVCLTEGISFVWTNLSHGIEAVLQKIGLTAAEGLAAESQIGTSAADIIAACILAPIFEEILCRGLIMRGLEKYGKVFAIVVSAVIFGLMHGNLTQTIGASLMGLILGYVAMEYGIKWSMFLHFTNNCIFCCLIEPALKKLELDPAITIMYALFFAASVVILIINRKKVASYLNRNRTDKKKRYLYTVLTASFITYTIIKVLEMTLFIARTGKG